MFLLLACEKEVQINDPYPSEATYCSVPDELEGEWLSDSIGIQTSVDTIDSTIVEQNPSVFYYLNVGCGETGSFTLSYYNYAGVETVDIDSKNFEADNGTIWIYSPLDSTRSRDEAEGQIQYSISNGQLLLEFSQEPNEGQVTDYSVFLSPLTED